MGNYHPITGLIRPGGGKNGLGPAKKEIFADFRKFEVEKPEIGRSQSQPRRKVEENRRMAGSGGQRPDTAKIARRAAERVSGVRKGNPCSGSARGPQRGSSARTRASVDRSRDTTGNPRRQRRRVATAGRCRANRRKSRTEGRRRPRQPRRENPAAEAGRDSGEAPAQELSHPSADGRRVATDAEVPPPGSPEQPQRPRRGDFGLTASKGLSADAGQEFGHVRSMHRSTASIWPATARKAAATGNAGTGRCLAKIRPQGHVEGVQSTEGEFLPAERGRPPERLQRKDLGRCRPITGCKDQPTSAAAMRRSMPRDLAPPTGGKSPAEPRRGPPEPRRGNPASGAGKAPREAPAQGFRHVPRTVESPGCPSGS